MKCNVIDTKNNIAILDDGSIVNLHESDYGIFFKVPSKYEKGTTAIEKYIFASKGYKLHPHDAINAIKEGNGDIITTGFDLNLNFIISPKYQIYKLNSCDNLMVVSFLDREFGDAIRNMFLNLVEKAQFKFSIVYRSGGIFKQLLKTGNIDYNCSNEVNYEIKIFDTTEDAEKELESLKNIAREYVEYAIDNNYDDIFTYIENDIREKYGHNNIIIELFYDYIAEKDDKLYMIDNPKFELLVGQVVVFE